MNVARASSDIDLTGSVYGAKFKEIEIVSGISASEVLPSQSKDRLNTLNYFSIPSASSTSDYVMIAKSGDGTLNYWMGDANFMATASYTYTINTTKPYVSGQQALVDIASAPNLENVNVAIFRGGSPLPSLNSGNGKILYYFNSDITSCYPESGSTIFNGSPSSSVKGSGSLVNDPTWSYDSGDSYIELDGTDDYIRVEKDDPLAGDYTVGAKVYFPNASASIRIISNFGNGSDSGVRFLLQTNGFGKPRLRWSDDGDITTNPGNLIAPDSLGTGEWHDVAFTYSQGSTTVQIYASGSFVASDTNATISTTNDASNAIAMIGVENNDGTAPFSKLRIKSWFIANSVLTTDEIAAMLSTGSV